MAAGLDFAGMVPGFDFLQNLMKGAGSALPAMGQWVAPTLDPAELDKRIGELRTVQFWLEQNAKLLGATIQAMEVQRMTLATLQTMNLPMADLREALTIKPPAPAPAPRPSPAPPPEPAPEPAPVPEAAAHAAPGNAAAAIDPMKWWGALTQQFTEIASQAIQASGADAQAAAASPRPRQAVTGVKELPAKTAAAKKMTLKKITAKKAAAPARARKSRA